MVRRTSAIFPLGAALLATFCGGGGTPEEAVETFNGHMAAKDFGLAAGLVYCRDWLGASDAELAAGRAAYADVLAERYDGDDLDYGRAEITERTRRSGSEVGFAVTYRRRARPSGPPVVLELTAKEIEGRWYYVPDVAVDRASASERVDWR
ncbi:MAG: hypothetical protein GTN49_07540 [candidate division Zixibacteria bacterium]|nr:hypothetical protein [candidate division Zixibacteria bacterium]